MRKVVRDDAFDLAVTWRAVFNVRRRAFLIFIYISTRNLSGVSLVSLLSRASPSFYSSSSSSSSSAEDELRCNTSTAIPCVANAHEKSRSSIPQVDRARTPGKLNVIFDAHAIGAHESRRVSRANQRFQSSHPIRTAFFGNSPVSASSPNRPPGARSSTPN